jgi:hypothetical protein
VVVERGKEVVDDEGGGWKREYFVLCLFSASSPRPCPLARPMITFTPLAGSAHSTRHAPLAYLLQVDDANILLDCGSPDWHPEQFGKSHSESIDAPFWETYCRELERCERPLKI